MQDSPGYLQTLLSGVFGILVAALVTLRVIAKMPPRTKGEVGTKRREWRKVEADITALEKERDELKDRITLLEREFARTGNEYLKLKIHENEDRILDIERRLGPRL